MSREKSYIMTQLDGNNHSVFSLNYHLILITKYRKEVITDVISEYLKHIFCYIAPKYKITLSEWNHDKDHIHILFKAEPDSEISKFINAYKAAVHKRIQGCFLEAGEEGLSGNKEQALEGVFLVKELLPDNSRRRAT